MHEPHFIFLLSYMVAVAAPVALAFNIDLTNPDVYTGEEKDFFGYKVLQFKSGSDKGIIVTAPLQLNGSGAICKPYHNKTLHCFNPEATSDSLTNKTIPIKHFGLSVAEDPTRSQLTVCSPSVIHECDDNNYLNSVCFQLSDRLQEISSFKPLFQDCTKKTVDLVFLFDGSGSMKEVEFNKNKDFIKDIMNTLKNTSIKFAAVQFSSTYRKVFDFNDYEAGRALSNLMKEPQLKTLTNTHRALKYVLEGLFENQIAGASPDAIQVLVLITDGDPSDTDRHGIIKKYDDKKIIRLVIGVKDANLDKFREIASEPKDKNAFKIENYDGLDTELKNFQKQIFTIEGSKAARAGNLTNEMSQSGFSAVFSKETLVLGSVGTNTWRGSLQEIHGEEQTQIADPEMEEASYMGYSAAVGEKNKAPLYFTGAPRFEHTGQVVLFRHDGKNWTTAHRIKGEQVGSYFGAELCSVDIDADGDTDFLLVGAPQFYQPLEKSEGQMYIYTLTHEMQLERGLTVPAVTMGRFGSTIASLADLNGDGLRDVAVGAPLEDDNRGAVYIYLGDRDRGIRSTFSQKIMGQKIKSGLSYFGQAIDGDIDLGDDGLPDIVVGSKGTAVVLRTRPIFNVTANLSFKPEMINTDKFDCLDTQDGLFPLVILQACFEMVKMTKSEAGTGLNITYTLKLDPTRQTYRGVFSQIDRKARNLTSTYELTNRTTCFDHNIYMPKCVKDTLSPISIKLNFSQVNGENAAAVLNRDSKNETSVEIPFEKRCRKNNTCIAELEVEFDFMSPTLLVMEDNYFNVSVTLTNHGDDSYNTNLTMHYPLGLNFARMNLTKWTRLTLHSCGGEEGVLDKTTCRISQPVYRSRSSATFKSFFHIKTEYEWDDQIKMTITGDSDNTNSTRINSLTKSIRVQFAIKMAITVKQGSDTFLNFTPEDIEPKKMVTIYKIDNPGFKGFPVNVSLFFPTRLEHDFEIEKYQVVVQDNKTKCTHVTDMNSEVCSAEKHCRIITCDTFILEKESSVEFVLSGDVQFRSLAQHAKNIPFLSKYTGESAEVKFKSFIHVGYEEHRYLLDPQRQQNNRSSKQEKPDGKGLWQENNPTMKSSEVGVEFIIPANEPLIIATGAGLGILLLIIITIIMIKCGCFKRKKVEDFQECEEEAAVQASTSAETKPDPTNGTVSQSETGDKLDRVSEEEKLLDGPEAKDGNNTSADTKEALD